MAESRKWNNLYLWSLQLHRSLKTLCLVDARHGQEKKMGLEKTTKEDKIEVIDSGDWKMVQVRTATIITEDGTELNRSFHRHVVSPADDWSDASAEVRSYL